MLSLFYLSTRVLFFGNIGMFGLDMLSLKFCSGSMVKLIKASLGLAIVKSLL